MKSKIILYMLYFNRDSMTYDLLSEHPERFEECSAEINNNDDLRSQLENLYSRYLDLHPDYIKFVHMEPTIEDGVIAIQYYCIIPYNDHEIKNSYKLPSDIYAQFIPNLRKILNVL